MILRVFRFLGRYAFGLAALVFTACAAPFSSRYREVLWDLLVRLRWRRPPANSSVACRIPTAEASRFTGRKFSVTIVEPDHADGNVSGYELLIISGVALRHARTACFEIGTFDGRTTLNVAVNSPDTCTIYTLDLPSSEIDNTDFSIGDADAKYIKKPTSGTRFAQSPHAKKICQIYGDSAAFDPTALEGKMDMVFIDGAHTYEYVHADTLLALRLLKPDRGIILWHDYGSRWWPGVTRALDELHLARPAFAGMRHIKGTTLVVWERVGPTGRQHAG